MYNNRGNAESKEDKKNSEVFYRISMKNPCTETITCDFIEVSKLRPGLVSIHFCPDSDPVCEEHPSRKGSENCRGLCKSKHSSKQVPGRTTAVLSIAKRKIISRRRWRCPHSGPELEVKPVLYPDQNQTVFRDLERTRSDAIDNSGQESGTGHWSSSSLCLKQLREYTPGWPLRKVIPLSKSEARELSVVQWVMTLPNRSSPVIMQTPAEENNNSMVYHEWNDERTSYQFVQTSENRSMDSSQNRENDGFGYKQQVSLQQSMLGWPLLQKTPPAELRLAEEMTVIQWAMSLPDRKIIGLIPPEKETNDSEVDTTGIYSPTASAKLLKGLDLLKINSSGCRWFSYEELKTATYQFSSDKLIGEGGCSSVYRGSLPCGQPVAVKISKSYREAWNNFFQEISIATLLNQEFIAPLIGICIENSHLISVYNFLARGSLEENLHGDMENGVLPWDVRFKVAVVVAEALNYLHEECSPPVIHRDIKSSNILLSNDFQPQLSDFGLATVGPTDSTEILDSEVMGTFGYIAPEYFMHGRVSDKIDIYSFGVVLLELLSGRRPIGSSTLTEEASLVKWAKPILENGDLKALVDPNLDGNFDSVQMHRVALAATSCINESAELRPKGSQLLRLLRGEKDVEEWFSTHVIRKREDVEFDPQLVSTPLLDNCEEEERVKRKRFTMKEYLRGQP